MQVEIAACQEEDEHHARRASHEAEQSRNKNVDRAGDGEERRQEQGVQGPPEVLHALEVPQSQEALGEAHLLAEVADLPVVEGIAVPADSWVLGPGDEEEHQQTRQSRQHEDPCPHSQGGLEPRSRRFSGFSGRLTRGRGYPVHASFAGSRVGLLGERPGLVGAPEGTGRGRTSWYGGRGVHPLRILASVVAMAVDRRARAFGRGTR